MHRHPWGECPHLPQTGSMSCLIQTEASDTNVRHPGRRLTKMRHRLLDLVRQHRRRIDLPHARRDDRCPQPSHVVEALQLGALPVPHDQRDRTVEHRGQGEDFGHITSSIGNRELSEPRTWADGGILSRRATGVFARPREYPPFWRRSRSFDMAVRATPNRQFCRSVVPRAWVCLPA